MGKDFHLLLAFLGILGLPLALLDLAEGGVAGGGADLGLLGALLLDHLLRRVKGGRSAYASRRAMVFVLVFHPHWDACAPAGLETRFDGKSALTGAGTYLEGSADERALAGLDGALLLAGDNDVGVLMG